MTHSSQSAIKNYDIDTRKPIISIIIPVFNQDEYLGRCIDSILQQEFSELEIILIDDASTDFTPQVCKNYSEKDSRIQVITNAVNKGQGYGRNIALMQALGKYVTFVDSDDYIENTFIIEGVQLLENTPHVDMVIFNRNGIDIHGKIVEQQLFLLERRAGKDVFEDFCRGKLRSYGSVAKVYRKNFLDMHDIKFPEYMWEDNLFALKSYYYARNIAFTGTHGYTRVYTPHAASAMTPLKFTPRHISGICSLVADINTFFTELAIEQDKVYAKSFEQHFIKRFQSFFSYMALCYHNNITPITHDNIQNLLKAKFFLPALLEKYALLYAGRIGFLNKTQNDSLEQRFLFNIYKNIQQGKTHTNEEIFNILAQKQNILYTLIKEYVLFVDKIYKSHEKKLFMQAISIYKQRVKVRSLFKKIQNMIPRSMIKSITENNFALVIDTYENTNFKNVLQFLKKQVLPTYVLADAYTTLAKHIQHYDIYGATELAFLAYKADPQVFRLKWFAFRCRETGEVGQAAAIFECLASNFKH